MRKTIETNKAEMLGTVRSEFVKEYESYGEGFYRSLVGVERLSGYVDMVPFIVSERILDVGEKWEGQKLYIWGQVRTYNEKLDCGNPKLKVSVFAREIKVLEPENNTDFTTDDINAVFLDGYICKKPVFRKTPQGREIADVLLAVNRPYGKSDYIPCIFWGRNAAFAESLMVGEHIWLEGRFQSRKYSKRLSENETEERQAYEVSASKIGLVQG